MEKGCFVDGRKDSGCGMEPVLEREEARARVEGERKPIVFWFGFLFLVKSCLEMEGCFCCFSSPDSRLLSVFGDVRQETEGRN